MPIIFKCKCNQYYSAQNKLVKKTFSCFKCGISLSVPDPITEQKEDILEVLFPEKSKSPKKESIIFEKSMRCQHCGARIVGGQKVCGLCGLANH